MAPDCVGPEVAAMKPAAGEVLLLRKSPVPSRRGGQQSGILEGVGFTRRSVRQRRVRVCPSGACVDGGDGDLLPLRRSGTLDG